MQLLSQSAPVQPNLISSVDLSPGLGDGNEESITALGFHRRLHARLINDARHAAKLGAVQRSAIVVVGGRWGAESGLSPWKGLFR
jgi:hypothetical protein